MSQIKFGSVCSGIEAASVAWHPLGWKTAWLSEIEKFPSQVLAHHYPNTPNFGDMTKFKEWSIESDVNVLVGGTPCQSFSVAGLRKGLDDPRGNLMLTYLAIASKYRPRWLVWENVPGVLSSNGGLDFASLLRGMGELGYGFAYRVLDAQYFGVAQRRRRVFVVGYLGNWRPAAAVLFERHSLQGHPAPSRKKRQATTRGVEFGPSGGRFTDVNPTLDSRAKDGPIRNQLAGCVATVQTLRAKRPGEGGMSHDHQHIVPVILPALNTQSGANHAPDTKAYVVQPIALQDVRAVEKMQNGKGWNDDGTAYTVDTHATQGVAQPIPLDMMNIRGRPSDDGRGNRIGRGYGEVGDPMFTITKANHHAVAQPIPFDTTQITSPQNGNNPKAGDPCHPLAAGAHPPAIAQTMAFSWQSGGDARGLDPKPTAQLQRCQTPAVVFGFDAYNQTIQGEVNQPLRVSSAPGQVDAVGGVVQGMAVRRLTPVECERLQGFPDGYTDIQPKGKATPDGPRYKALGNSMAVPVMAWIGKRIQQVEDILG